MDDALIYLESDDEITAIIDRLRSATADEVRLIVPKGALVLQSLVSLKLLKREADHLGKDIALVTQDAIGLNLGEQANISVYAKAKDTSPVFAAHPSVSSVQKLTQPPSVTREEQDSNEIEENQPILSKDTQDVPIVTSAPVEEAPPVEAEAIPGGIAVHYYREPIASQSSPSAKRSDQPRPSAQAVLRQVGRRPASFSGGIGRWLKFLVGFAILGTIGWTVFLIFFPRATIALAVATDPFEQAITVTAETDLNQPDYANAKIPATALSKDISVERSAPATGKKDVGTKATATLNLYNYWDANTQSFPTGTTVRSSDGVLFVMTTAATIPGASTTLREGKVVTTPGKTSVVIEANDPGADANGKSGTFTIPSLPTVRQDKIYGDTVAPTAGGTSKQLTVVTASDRDALKNTMKDALTTEAKTALSDLSPNGRLLDGAINVAVKDEQFSADVDAQADTLTLKDTATVQTLIFTDDNLNTAAEKVLEKQIPATKTLVLKTTDTLTPTVKNFDTAGGKLEIESTYKTRVAPALDLTSIADSLTNLSVPAAQQKLRVLPGVASISIQNRPQWLKTLPKRDSQIHIQVTYTDQPPTSS